MSSLNTRIDNRTRDVSTETLRDLYNKSIRTGQHVKEYMIKQNIPEDSYVSGQAFDDRKMLNFKMSNRRGSSALNQGHAIDSSRGFTFTKYVDRLEGKPLQPYSSFTDGVYMDVAAVQGYFKSNSIFSMGNQIDQSNLISRMNPIQHTTITQSASATPVAPASVATTLNFGSGSVSPVASDTSESPMYDHPLYHSNIEFEKDIFLDKYETIDSLMPILEKYFKDVDRVMIRNNRGFTVASNKKIIIDDNKYTYKTLIPLLFNDRRFILNEIDHKKINKRIKTYELNAGNYLANPEYDYNDLSAPVVSSTPQNIPISIRGINTRSDLGVSDTSLPTSPIVSSIERSSIRRNIGKVLENPSL